MLLMHIPRPLIAVSKLLLTLLLLFLVFQSIDIAAIRRDLRVFDWESLVPLLVFCWLGQLLCAERWRILAGALGMHGSYLRFVQMYFAGMLFNIGLPSLIGGDAVKAYMLSRKSQKPLYLGLASVLQDRASGLITLLLYGSIAAFVFPLSWQGLPLWTMYLLCWLAVGLALGLVFRGDLLRRRFQALDHRPMLQGILRTASDFHQALGNCAIAKSALFRVSLLSLIYSALVLWIFRQVTAAAGHSVPLTPFAALFPLVTLATMLPVTFNGVGVREWFYVEGLALLGVPRNTGLCISLATSALILLSNLAGLLVLPWIFSELRHRGDLAVYEHDSSRRGKFRDLHSNDIIQKQVPYE